MSTTHDIPYPEAGGYWINKDGTRRTDILAVSRTGYDTVISVKMPDGLVDMTLQEYSKRAERSVWKGSSYHAPSDQEEGAA